MPQYRNNHKQAQRGSAIPALKVTLVVVLLVGASAAGFMVIGPFLSKLGHSASVSSTTQNDQSAEANPADSQKKPDEASKERAPRVVSDDTGSLASIYIAERPGPEGNVIHRKAVESPPSSDEESNGPTVEPPDTSQPERPTRPTVEGPKPKETPVKTTPTTPPTASGAGTVLYRVQLGLFMERDTAEAKLAEARAKGFDVSLVHKVTSSRTYYGVQAGAFSNREGAESVRSDLIRSGFSPTIVEEKRE